jgi:hypothetical protein
MRQSVVAGKFYTPLGSPSHNFILDLIHSFVPARKSRMEAGLLA